MFICVYNDKSNFLKNKDSIRPADRQHAQLHKKF